jgi:hypothetical protein
MISYTHVHTDSCAHQSIPTIFLLVPIYALSHTVHTQTFTPIPTFTHISTHPLNAYEHCACIMHSHTVSHPHKLTQTSTSTCSYMLLHMWKYSCMHTWAYAHHTYTCICIYTVSCMHIYSHIYPHTSNIRMYICHMYIYVGDTFFLAYIPSKKIGSLKIFLHSQ